MKNDQKNRPHDSIYKILIEKMNKRYSKKTLKAGEVYCLQERVTRKWFAFQVVGVDGDDAYYVLLDYFCEEKPTEDNLNGMSQLEMEREVHKYNCYHALASWFPVAAICIGVTEIKSNVPCRTWGRWPDGREYRWLEDWRMEQEEERHPKLKQGLENVQLKTDETVLDLRNTRLKEVKAGGADLELLRLPDTCGRLTLEWPLNPRLRIECFQEGLKLFLMMDLHEHELPDLGLRNLQSLSLFKVGRIDAQKIAAYYPLLGFLAISGKPGTVVGNSSTGKLTPLAHLKNLEDLIVHNLMDFQADDFPHPQQWESLYSLWMTNIPKEVGVAIRRAYKNQIADLNIRQLRTAEWFKENASNPFAHWDGNEGIPTTVYQKSVGLRKSLKKEVNAAQSLEPEQQKSTVRNAVIAYIEGFNQINRRRDFIETVEREDIVNACEEVTKSLPDSFDQRIVIETIEEQRKF